MGNAVASLSLALMLNVALDHATALAIRRGSSSKSSIFDASASIVGGVEVNPPGKYPFMVKTLKCGGSLIAAEWVLTAAHCISTFYQDFPSRYPDVHIGRHRIDSGGVALSVVDVVLHAHFSNELAFDAALLKLAEPVSDFEPIGLDNGTFSSVGTNDTVIGWGKLGEGGQPSDVLQEVNLPIISNGKCNEALKGFGVNIFASDICAGVPEGGKDACRGDSGGPMFYTTEDGEHFLTGIVSRGYGCARPEAYGVYTRVSSLLPWIYMITETCDVQRRSYIGDGFCDKTGGYNIDACSYDFGDCCPLSCVDGKYSCGINGYDCVDAAFDVAVTQQHTSTSVTTLPLAGGATTVPTDAATVPPTSPPSTTPSDDLLPVFTEPTTLPPSVAPTQGPTSTLPTVVPTSVPTSSHTLPGSIPTLVTPNPSRLPSLSLSEIPTSSPSRMATHPPSSVPTTLSTRSPTFLPTSYPTNIPANSPTFLPTKVQISTQSPSFPSSLSPSSLLPQSPSSTPSQPPPLSPTFLPATSGTNFPSDVPTRMPTNFPTRFPTSLPAHTAPAEITPHMPTEPPNLVATHTPTQSPSLLPTSSPPDLSPAAATDVATHSPSLVPTHSHTQNSTSLQTTIPTGVPTDTQTLFPTQSPSPSPTHAITQAVTPPPTFSPTDFPTVVLTNVPTKSPSSMSTHSPTLVSTSLPTGVSTDVTSGVPTWSPTSPEVPTGVPAVPSAIETTEDPQLSPSTPPNGFSTLAPTSSAALSSSRRMTHSNRRDDKLRQTEPATSNSAVLPTRASSIPAQTPTGAPVTASFASTLVPSAAKAPSTSDETHASTNVPSIVASTTSSERLTVVPTHETILTGAPATAATDIPTGAVPFTATDWNRADSWTEVAPPSVTTDFPTVVSASPMASSSPPSGRSPPSVAPTFPVETRPSRAKRPTRPTRP